MTETPTRGAVESEPPTLVIDGGVPRVVNRSAKVHSVSRFLVVEQIGKGGMGRVFRAYDPSLAREVAIKLLHSGVADDEASERLVREAQAMAQLSHPNIVTIYEVGRDGGQVFLAMELVVGRTLGTYCRDESPGAAKILGLFRQAAVGLEAAHRAGIVHRDFKPANVLIGEDGRVRVGDFGLAKTSGHREDSDEKLLGGSIDSTQITGAGQVIGTPAYMAPEQHANEELTPACDQFAFGVALYEILEGTRPFPQRELQALLDAKATHAFRPFRKTPARLTRVVARLIAPRLEDRYADMGAVASALAPRKLRGPLWAGGVVCLVGGALLLSEPPGAQGPTCETDAVEQSWNLEARAQMEQGFSDSEAPYASDTFAAASTLLDAYVAAWKDVRTDACVHEDSEQANALAQARHACLDQANAQLAALVDVMRAPTELAVERAPEYVDELPDLKRCSDPGYVRRQFGGDVDVPGAKELEREIDVLVVEAKTATIEPADLRRFEDAALRAEHHQPALHTRAAQALGEAQIQVGQTGAGLETLRAAYLLAVKHSLWTRAAELAVLLASGVGDPPAPAETRLAWGDHAGAMLDHVDAPQRIAVALELARAAAYNQNGLGSAPWGEYHARRAVSLAARPETDAYIRARALRSMGLALVGTRKIAEAKNYLAAAVELDRGRYGDVHPDVAADLNYLMITEFTAGEYTQARATAQETFEVHLALWGPTEQNTLDAQENLGVVCMYAADLACAKETFEAVLEIRDSAPDPSPRSRATLLNNLGDLYGRLGEPERGIALVEEALRLRTEAGLPPGHAQYGYAHVILARLRLDLDEPAAALQHLEIALRQEEFTAPRQLADSYLIRAQARRETGALALDVAADLDRAEAAIKLLAFPPEPLLAELHAQRKAAQAYSISLPTSRK